MPRDSLVVKLPLPGGFPRSRPSQGHPVVAARNAVASNSTYMASATIAAHFTQSQLSLALTLLKSKPDEVSASDYLQLLRKNIKHGQPTPKEQLGYVDTTEFWKDEYDKIYKEKKALEDKVNSSEEARRISEERLRGDTNTETHRSPKGKEAVRWHGHSELIEAGMSRKRLAPSQDIEDSEDEADLDAVLGSDINLILSGYAFRTIQQRSRLEQAAQQSSTLEQIENLHASIIQTTKYLEAVVADCCLPLRHLRTSNEDPRTLFLVQQVLHQVALSFQACFGAVSALFLTIPGRAKKSEIIYRMVMFFKTSIDVLHMMSTLQSEAERDRRHQTSRRKRNVEKEEYAANKYLTRTIASIAAGVQWKLQPGHKEILEGILFSVFEHTGRLISDAVFGEHVAASDNTGNITKSADVAMSKMPGYVSRYTVQILHAFMGDPARRQLIAQILSPANSNFSGSASGTASAGDSFGKAKSLLQSTLLKSIVGGVDLKSLSLPRPPAEHTKVDEVGGVERYGKDWLLEMVWGLVGWDLVT